MSYRKPLLIQNNPGQGIAQAIAGAGKEIANSVADYNIQQREDLAVREARIAQQKAKDDADGLRMQSELNSDSQDFLDAGNEVKIQLGEQYNSFNEEIYSFQEQIKNGSANNLSPKTMQELNKGLVGARNKKQVMKDFIAGVGMDKEEAPNFAEGGYQFNTDGKGKPDMAFGYNRFLQNVPGYTITTKKGENNDFKVILNTPDGEHELPYKDIASGNWEPMVKVPQVFEGVTKAVEDFTGAIKGRPKGTNSINQGDLDGALNIYNAQSEQVMSQLKGYSKTNLNKFRGALSQQLGYDDGKIADMITEMQSTSPDAAWKEVDQAVKEKVAMSIARNSGMELQADGKFIEMKEEAEPTVTKLTQSEKYEKGWNEVTTTAFDKVKGDFTKTDALKEIFGISNGGAYGSETVANVEYGADSMIITLNKEGMGAVDKETKTAPPVKIVKKYNNLADMTDVMLNVLGSKGNALMARRLATGIVNNK